MKTQSHRPTRTLFRSVAAAATGAALIAGAASPAQAQSHRDRYRDRDGISAGEIIAGAVIIGGLAAILSNNDRDRYDDRYGRYDRNDGYNGDYRYDRDTYGYDYRRYGNARSAVSQCVNAVRQDGARIGNARVTDITRIDRTRTGYEVKGTLAVRDGYSDRWDRSDRYDRYDRYGYRDADRGKFTCQVRYGDVRDVRYSGVRGLR